MPVKKNKPSRSKFLEGKIIPLKCYTQSKHIMTDEKCQGFKQGKGGECSIKGSLQNVAHCRNVYFLEWSASWDFLLVHLNILLPK